MKLCDYAKLNCLKSTDFYILLCVNKNLYLYKTELVEIELFLTFKLYVNKKLYLY